MKKNNLHDLKNAITDIETYYEPIGVSITDIINYLDNKILYRNECKCSINNCNCTSDNDDSSYYSYTSSINYEENHTNNSILDDLNQEPFNIDIYSHEEELADNLSINSIEFDSLEDCLEDNSYISFNKKLLNMKNSIKICQVAYGSNLDFQILFKHNNTLINISNINDSIIQSLYDIAKDSPFGNLKTLKTEYDKNIRSAKELLYNDDFYIYYPLIEFIKNIWKKKFHKNVIVEPYKINIYDVGNGFTWHVDTPNKNLIGTFIIGLCNCFEGGEFKIKTINDNNQFQLYCEKQWDGMQGSWITFYSDLQHMVMPIIKGYRATLTFKIYQTDDNIEMISRFNTKEYEFLKDNVSYGLLLSHLYSLDTKELKGIDKYIYDILIFMGAKIDIISVVVIYYHSIYTDEYEEENTILSKVYEINTDVINFINKKSIEKIISKYNDLSFYTLSKGKIMVYNFQEEMPYLGNESNPEEVNSIYLHRALIINFN